MPRQPVARPEPLLERIAELRAHPAFPTALWIIVDRYIRTHADNLVTKLVVSDARYWVTQVIVSTHAEYVTGMKGSRLTATALVRRAQSLPWGGVSRGQITSLLSLLRARGRILPAPGEEGRRNARLVPSPMMLREQYERAALHLEALDAILPGHGHWAKLRTDPLFYLAIERARGAVIDHWGNPLRHFPDIAAIAGLDAGYSILARLLQSTAGRPGMPQAGPCRLHYARTAQTLGTSRTQVRRVADMLADRGLLEIQGRGGDALFVTQRLIDMLAEFHALRLLRFDHMATAATTLLPTLRKENPPR